MQLDLIECLDPTTQTGIDQMAEIVFEITTNPPSPIFIRALGEIELITDRTAHDKASLPEIRVQAAHLGSVILNFEINNTKLAKEEKEYWRNKVANYRAVITAYDEAQKYLKAA